MRELHASPEDVRYLLERRTTRKKRTRDDVQKSAEKGNPPANADENDQPNKLPQDINSASHVFGDRAMTARVNVKGRDQNEVGRCKGVVRVKLIILVVKREMRARTCCTVYGMNE